MKVAIIYYQLLSHDGTEQRVGGVETYLMTLSELCVEMGWQPIVFQAASNRFVKQIDKITVVGVPTNGLHGEKKRKQLFLTAISQIDLSKDLLIFGADHCSIHTTNKRCISIQHGVSWDLPTQYLTRKNILMSGLGAIFLRWLNSRVALNDFNNCINTVCVDYNFLNWYRTQIGDEPQGKTWVIPNFASSIIDSETIFCERSKKSKVDILFARRFTQVRGVRLIVDVVKELLKCQTDVGFTFAGEGPEETWMRAQFTSDSRVKFIKYLPHESMTVHAEHDIAVIPSIGSEGTSFSLAEAMGAGCAIVASNVGGMTNMIIDGYNGFLLMPEKTSFITGIQGLILDRELRVRLGEKALETAKASFSLPRWKTEWRTVLEEVSRE